MMADKFLVAMDLPEPIIQHIQSLVTGKEAARTTILSKSWHRAWLTRPNLDLDESDFKARYFYRPFDEFSYYARKTAERYQASNLKINSFKLCMTTTDRYAAAPLANELIVKAFQDLGATRLSFQLRTTIPFTFHFPCEVVFGSHNLLQLSLQGFPFYLNEIDVKCRRLESLCLDRVDTDTVSKIILSCPLIENLSLSNIRCHRRNGREERARSAATCHHLVDRLKCLVLCLESFKTFFPGDFLSKFPFLRDLTLIQKRLRHGGGVGDVQISNSSLQCIKIQLHEEEKDVKVRLDVPNIRKFTFEGGDIIPELSFVSTTKKWEWESHVSLARYGNGGPFWFSGLNELLTVLRHSKINLSLHVVGFDYRVGDLSITRRHELESLTIDMTGLPCSSCYALFEGLFRLCRPRLLVIPIPKEGKTNVDLLWHALEQGMHVSNPRLSDLEEVNAQIFDDDATGWRPPIPFKSFLLLQPDIVDNQQPVRLLLKWKPS